METYLNFVRKFVTAQKSHSSSCELYLWFEIWGSHSSIDEDSRLSAHYPVIFGALLSTLRSNLLPRNVGDWLNNQPTNKPTNSTEQSSSREVNRFSATQKISRILWNPKVYCRIHKSPPRVPVLSQINAVHDFPPTSGRSILILFSHLRTDL